MTKPSPSIAAAAAAELLALWSDLPGSGQSGMNPWAIEEDLGNAGRIALDRGLVPILEKGRWKFRPGDFRSPPDWRPYLEAFGLGCFDAEVVDHGERVARGWPLGMEECIAMFKVERDEMRAASEWPGLEAAEDRMGREAGWFDDEGRPWWGGRENWRDSIFLHRCGTRVSYQRDGLLPEIQADLVRELEIHALLESRRGRVPVQGIGRRWVFVVPPEPYLDPWFMYLETLERSEVADEYRRQRWPEWMWILRSRVAEELRRIQEQELEEHPEMRLHEEWAYTFDEVLDEESGAFVTAPFDY